MGYPFVAEVDVCDPEDSAVEAQVGTFTPSNGNHQESVAAGSGDEAGEEIAEETAVITATDSPTNGTMRASLTPDRADLSADHFPGDRFQVDRSAAASGTTEAEVTAAQGLKLWKIAVPVLLVALLAAGGLYYRTHRSKPLTDKDTIVLADFANSTGDPVFDDTLKTALNVSLRQSPFLNVLPGRQFTQTLKLMALPADAKLTPEQTRELCQRVGSKAYVAGSIASLGSQYVLGLKAVNCVSGDPLAEEQVTAASKEKVLDALGEAASKLRGELGESLATVQKYDVPLAQATTSSLEALKAYSRRTTIVFLSARSFLMFNAPSSWIRILPQLTLARACTITISASLCARDYFTKAFQLREHASEPERLDIASNYYQSVTGELDKAAKVLEQEVEDYPAVPAYLNLGNVYAELGQYGKAVETTRQYLPLASDKDIYRANCYVNLANFSLALQRFDEARQVIDEAQAKKYRSSSPPPISLCSGVLRGRHDGDGGRATEVREAGRHGELWAGICIRHGGL